jgi:hypothetical protein
MSAQGGTLQRRGTIELPIWPVAVLVIAVIAAAIGITMLRSEGQTTFVTSVSESERFSNSTAAVREQGATLPVAPSLPASTGYAGFENPAANGTVAWGSIGGPNEALHRQYSLPKEGVALTPGSEPIMVNGEACMQCR